MPHSTVANHPTESTTLDQPSHAKSGYGDNKGEPIGAGNGIEKFPDFELETSRRSQSVNRANGDGARDRSMPPSDRWMPRLEHQAQSVKWTAPRRDSRTTQSGGRGHSRQKSFSQTIRHMRSASVSQNAHEIADALRAPVSWKLIALCVMWYWSSALTNTSSKSILNAFDKPATLTLIQFAIVSSYCLLFSWLASAYPRLRATVPALRHPIRHPSWDVIRTTFPLALFQIGGHLFSSTATSKIPVSLVHTIKGLSPLFTVFAYRIFYDIRYPVATYLSLIPLTFGVMLACSGKHGFDGQLLGVFYALLATIVFVTQNIFSKRLFNEASRAEAEGHTAQSRKLDKLNLLCYSSGLAFLFTSPIWIWSEGLGIVGDFLYDGSVDLNKTPTSFDHGRLTLEFLFNGTFHFGQNILAFVILSIVSPVTYSVASLIKRVFVIAISIIWFQSATTRLQAVGIGLTFLGLYLYDRTSESNKADRKARNLTETANATPLLPLNVRHALSTSQNAPVFVSPISLQSSQSHPYTNGLAPLNEDDNKKSDDPGRGRSAANAGNSWLPPGTKQEETWLNGDKVAVRA